MRFLAGFIGFILVVALCDAAVVQRRTHRNTEELLVPVAIIQDGEAIQEPAGLTGSLDSSQNEHLRTEVEAAAQDQHRRIDEAVYEEEIKETVQAEEINEENKLPQIPLPAEQQPQLISQPVVQLSENIETIKEPAQAVNQSEEDDEDTQTDNHLVLIIAASNDEKDNALRQATQATPTQTTTQQNFVQQLIQNSPLGQFFNQITGQTTQSQVASDENLAGTVPTLPGIFNPVAAVQNAAQSVVNTTTQAFQGLQQFASNLGNQFQSTLSSLGGQQPDQAANDATSARPPGPIQQLVNTFIGTPQQNQPANPQQGPLQGLLNIFQGNNRPQGAIANSIEPAPAKEPEIQEETQAADNIDNPQPSNDEINNELRDSAESSDSFEDSLPPGELIVVSDDVTPTENEQLKEAVPK